MFHRFRRLRQNKLSRDMLAETRLSKDSFVLPYFIVPGQKKKETISTMPNLYRFSTDTFISDIEKKLNLGINKILLFGSDEPKTEDARYAYAEESVVIQAVKQIRKEFGQAVYVMTDVCLCAYTTHGHCGLIEGDTILNDPSLEILAKMALAHARAGADMVAPSDMMDGRIAFIRNRLDKEGYSHTPIMAYSTKFASSYYGPFRDAAHSAPQFGDRKTYQMDYRNLNEAIAESLEDEAEGADVLMVKPALAYLDVIAGLKQQAMRPVACYNVSGEYAMVKQAVEKGLADERALVMENMYAFARAGADIIISYHTEDIFSKGWL